MYNEFEHGKDAVATASAKNTTVGKAVHDKVLEIKHREMLKKHREMLNMFHGLMVEIADEMISSEKTTITVTMERLAERARSHNVAMAKSIADIEGSTFVMFIPFMMQKGFYLDPIRKENKVIITALDK